MSDAKPRDGNRRYHPEPCCPMKSGLLESTPRGSKRVIWAMGIGTGADILFLTLRLAANIVWYHGFAGPLYPRRVTCPLRRFRRCCVVLHPSPVRCPYHPHLRGRPNLADMLIHLSIDYPAPCTRLTPNKREEKGLKPDRTPVVTGYVRSHDRTYDFPVCRFFRARIRAPAIRHLTQKFTCEVDMI